MSGATLNSSATPTVSATDRLGFTLFMAVALHAVFILGSSFVSTPSAPPLQTLEITLAQYAVEKPPEKTDFLAQANQLASGTVEEKRLPSTTERSAFQDDKISNQSAPPVQPANKPEPTPIANKAQKKPVADKGEASQTDIAKRAVVTTTAEKKKKVSTKPRKTESAPSQPKAGHSTSLLAKSLEIANLQAQIKMQQEQFAQRPKTRRLTSVSTTMHEDAIYLDNWRRRIEMVGNMNYPEEARRQKIYGTLRVLVAIYPDGGLKSVEITQSSGSKTLDDAAIRIVKLASPFQPFSVEMRKSTDVLEIIRSWKFEKNTHLY
ncbi:energy transducer TonB [Neptunomonas qingdaonensis]|uniref:Protein TonB n=1 Tax=Neptunomonas qingdaonensis TaxID=1045558 RepID=A0A1I2M162_9GAMM|nr:energy transducer TonB [Neptunomonas qingdaonensis]SFF85203.1 protein TonB [Neptunomonas qingdaonensis]